MLGDVGKSVEKCIEWCVRWGENNEYDLSDINCWSMVQSFCKHHKIKVPEAPAHQVLMQAVGNASGIPSLVSASKKISKGKLDQACLYCQSQ